jgi:hypothetical protein
VIPTLRRLNDRERYYGLTFPGWLGLATAGAVLYGAVKLSPLNTKATVTVVVLILAFAATVLAGLSGQALSPLRHLTALVGHHRSARTLESPAGPDRFGLVLDRAPDPNQLGNDADDPQTGDDWLASGWSA